MKIRQQSGTEAEKELLNESSMTFNIESSEMDDEMRSLNVQQLKQERHGIATQLLHVQQQISDLAYGNYRIYADAGSTTERCRRMFGEASDLLDSIESEIGSMANSFSEFSKSCNQLASEFKCLRLAESKSSPLWDILSLPARMDICIRAGYYDVAHTLTNYGIQLQSYELAKNSVIKAIAEKLIAARYRLLDELFNRFAGQIDLPTSIQVVNNIRKIPYLSPTQLRTAILQYRDVYLEKQLMDIKSQPDFILRMVEVYRDCMYDTMVLYLAVFPEVELGRRDPSVDPRWNVWQTVGYSAILSEWVLHNLSCMFDHIRNDENASAIDSGVLSSKLMSFAMSFGRMGVDFRPLVVNVITEVVDARFGNKVMDAANKMRRNKLVLSDGDIPETMTANIQQVVGQPTPPPMLAFWDDLCIYGNELLDALNEIRSGLSTLQFNSVRNHLSHSLKIVMTWLDGFGNQPQHQASFKKAVKLFMNYFVPFINKCLLVLFPYEKCCRSFHHSGVTMEQYERECLIDIKQLYSDCVNIEVIKEVVSGENMTKDELSNVGYQLNDVEENKMVENNRDIILMNVEDGIAEVEKNIEKEIPQNLEDGASQPTEVIFMAADDGDEKEEESNAGDSLIILD